MKHPLSKLSAIIAISTFSACATLPSNGPTSNDMKRIQSSAEVSSLGIEMVKIDQSVTKKLGQADRDIASFDLSKARKNVTVQTSDVLAVRIWEANPDGLFSSPENPAAPIKVTVSEEGNIFVPYAGMIKASGRKMEDIRTSILDALQGKVIDPQIQLELQSSTVSTASVIGGVGQPGQYPITLGNDTLLQMLSTAGGPKSPAFETRVTVIRDNKAHQIKLSDLYESPLINVPLWPGDVIELEQAPEHFLAFGAVARRGQIGFDAAKVTLDQAIALSGGLNDRLADAGGIFLFRLEATSRLQSADLVPTRTASKTPVIYQLDMTQPEAFFLARAFEIFPDDILYVANSPAADLNKFISTIIGPVLGSADTIQSINN